MVLNFTVHGITIKYVGMSVCTLKYFFSEEKRAYLSPLAYCYWFAQEAKYITENPRYNDNVYYQRFCCKIELAVIKILDMTHLKHQ